MKTIPAIDSFFNLEEALKADGFDIDEKDFGVCVANFNQVYIELHQSFINEFQADMRITKYDKSNNGFKTLFEGVAPTNQNDYHILMQLVFPSDEFKNRLYLKYIDNQ